MAYKFLIIAQMDDGVTFEAYEDRDDRRVAMRLPAPAKRVHCDLESDGSGGVTGEVTKLRDLLVDEVGEWFNP